MSRFKSSSDLIRRVFISSGNTQLVGQVAITHYNNLTSRREESSFLPSRWSKSMRARFRQDSRVHRCQFLPRPIVHRCLKGRTGQEEMLIVNMKIAAGVSDA